MSSKKMTLYTGLNLLGDLAQQTTWGGVSGTLVLPEYSHRIQLHINHSHQDPREQFENSTVFRLSLAELEGLHRATERVLNDLRKLEALARNKLLTENAYSELTEEVPHTDV